MHPGGNNSLEKLGRNSEGVGFGEVVLLHTFSNNHLVAGGQVGAGN